MSSAAQVGALAAVSFQQQQQPMDAAASNINNGHFCFSAGPGDPDYLFDLFIILDGTATAESSSTSDEDALFSQLMTDETTSSSPLPPPPWRGDSKEEECDKVQTAAATTTGGRNNEGPRAVVAAGQQRTLEPSPLPRPPPLVLGATNDDVGSIPDSQLLRLEELSVCPPRHPPLAAAGIVPSSSSSSSPPLIIVPNPRQPLSPAKRPGKLESLYSTIRRSTTSIRRPSRPALQPETIAPAQTIRNSEGGGGGMGVMTAEMAFVAGYVDDPFVDFSGDSSVLDGLPPPGLPPLAETSKAVDHRAPVGDSSGARCASMYSSASWPTPAGQWPTTTTTPTSAALPPAATATPTNQASDTWWDVSSGDPMMDAAAALNMAMHLQQSEMAYEYVPPPPPPPLRRGSSSNSAAAGVDLASAGLMILMPQPRGPGLTHASLMMSPPPPPPAFHT